VVADFTEVTTFVLTSLAQHGVANGSAGEALVDTSWPRAASSDAIAAAIVVLPTPPFPIVSTTPRPSFSMASTMARSDPGMVASDDNAGSLPDGTCSLVKIDRRPFAPSGARASSLTSVRGSVVSAVGNDANASRPRISSACAMGSVGSMATKIPLIISRWWVMPSAASSAAVRAASVSAEGSGRVTRITVVTDASANAARLARYNSRWLCSPDNGPRQDVPVLLVSMNVVQAAGSVSSRNVWPVGAVSKITWSKPAVVVGFARSAVN